MEPPLQEIVPRVEGWAREAGQLLLECREALSSLTVETKSSARDLVTSADVATEELLIQKIQESFPDDGVLAEESGSMGNDAVQWCIDPLDGTVNFVHGLPMFGVSIARLRHGEPELAVVYLPVLNEMFVAMRGGGAFLNQIPITVSSAKGLDSSVVATGFPYRRNQLADNNLENFNRVFLKVRGLRRMGSAAIDLAYVDSGKLDVYWELHLSPWDAAAGALLVREAGGMVDTVVPGGDWLHGKNILAGPSGLVEELREHLLQGRGSDYPPLGDRTELDDQ